MTNEEKEELLEKIEKSYALGVKEVKHGEKEVKYRSLSEMSQIIHKLRRELGKTKKSYTKKVTFNKGF